MDCFLQLLCCSARQLIREEMFGVTVWEGSGKTGGWYIYLSVLKNRRERALHHFVTNP